MKIEVTYKNGMEIVEVKDGAGIDAIKAALKLIERKMKKTCCWRTVVGLKVVPG